MIQADLHFIIIAVVSVTGGRIPQGETGDTGSIYKATALVQTIEEWRLTKAVDAEMQQGDILKKQ